MPSLSGFVRGLLHQRRSCQAKEEILRSASSGSAEISRADWPSSIEDPTAFYAHSFLFFHNLLPAELRQHRQYFSEARRGFGEEAFHAMWFLLFREFRPRNFLEIGVYRGQVLSLACLLQRILKIEGGDLTGISPFAPVGDAVSKYGKHVNYLKDTLTNFAHFDLPNPRLVKAYSTDQQARACIAAHLWDCIYIDGNHDYEIAKADWENCAAGVREGGVIVLDDSGRGTCYEPPPFATKGHPGPSRVAEEIDRARFAEILQVGHNRVFQKIAAS